MAKAQSTKAVNLRIPTELWTEIKILAESRKLSFNRVAEESLAKAAEEARRQRVRAAFADLAEPGDDVEWAIPAQSEVVFSDGR